MNHLFIQPLTQDLLEDYLAYFDHEAFVDNPHWAGCYCQFYLTDHRRENWEAMTAADNRQSAEERIKNGKMSGYLARLDQKMVGWCHAAPKLTLLGLADEQELETPQDAQVGTIVCFNVAPAYRGRGIAAALLQSVLDGFRQQGLDYAEAYPRTQATSQASNYHGPLRMYLQAGFTTYREFDSFLMVRKTL